jgi:Chitobiase/beta-hexosaminidase C-terminal domain
MDKALILFLLIASPCYGQGILSQIMQTQPSAGGSLTLAHHWQSSACGNATTCSVTITGGVSTGDLVVISVSTLNEVSISSVNVGGTTIDANIRSGISTNKFLTAAYIYPATSTAGPMVVTFSAASGGAQVNIRDYTVSGGTPALDATNDLSSASGLSSPTPGVSMTTTGTGDVVIEVASADVNVTAITSPWSTNADFATDETGAGTADAFGRSSGFTAPNWTAAALTVKETEGMAFGFNVTPCTPGAMFDSSGGTNTAAPTATTLSNSTFGATGAASPLISGNEPWSWGVTNNGPALTYSTSAHKALLGSAPRFCNGGTTYSDSASLGLELTTANGNNTINSIAFTFPYQTSGFGVSPIVLMSAWYQTTLGQTDTVNCDCLTIGGSGSGGTTFANLIVSGSGTQLQAELEGATAGSPVPISSSTWYQMALEYAKSGIIKLNVYDSSGFQVGNTMTGVAGNGPALDAIVGNNLASTMTSGAFMYWDKVQFCYLGCTDAQYPLGIPVHVNTPVDSPGAGTYSNTASMSLTAINSSSIYYTTDGSTPSCAGTGTSTLYSTAVTISSTETVKSIGCTSHSLWVNSAVLTSTYTITSAITAGPGASSGIQTASPATMNFAIPSNAGNHAALVVGIVADHNATACTYNGTSMTALATRKVDGAGVWGAQQFILINPTADGAAHSISCTIASVSNANIFAQSFFGVNQTGTVGNSWRTPPAGTNDGGSGTGTASITVTTVSSDMVVDVVSDFNKNITGPGGSQTQLFLANNISGSGLYMGVSDETASTTSTAMTWTFAASAFWAQQAVSLIQG